jgi:hypothetical protein
MDFFRSVTLAYIRLTVCAGSSLNFCCLVVAIIRQEVFYFACIISAVIAVKDPSNTKVESR